jgi:PadR family transcriptional regulator, regulatory protein PadR
VFLYMVGSGIKRGTAELAILSVLEAGELHGYEIARRIERQTDDKLRFTLASLYPLLYRMEKRGWVRGEWQTGNTGRRRRCYRLTSAGKKKLAPLRAEWAELFRALRQLEKVADA